MEIILREMGNKLLRFPFSPQIQSWKKQSLSAQFCIANLGNVTCFVKRRPNKPFSGWGLLIKAISDEQIRHVPRIISLATNVCSACKKNYYYYFTEWMNGVTLEEFLKKPNAQKIDLKTLINVVFVALKNINQLGYWYTDLCKKNIFVLGQQSFSLIDLDSCISSTQSFNNLGGASFDYAPLLTEFARKQANKNLFQIRGVTGECVNQAEVVALAADMKKLLTYNQKIPPEKKISVLHGGLTREHRSEYCDLFLDLIESRPNWIKTRKLIDRILA